ncbi:hypothetical protein CF328_g9352, partial [Tilletia controversa]
VPGATNSTPPRGVLVFRRLPTPTKKVFREVLGQLGSSVDKVIDGLTDADLEDSQPSLSTPAAEITVDNTVPSISITPSSSSSSRFRPCKPEYLPTYDGNPLELEKYLGRIGGILRTDPDEAWELAVLRSMPIRFSGDAEEWHSGMSPADAKRLVTFSDMAEAMRKEFRANRSEQRRLARARVWMPTAEPVATFYHVKLRALRVAFGQDQTDSVLVEDIVDSLPPTFRAMLRLPRVDPMLDDLRAELGTWEDTWRQIHPQFALRPAVTSPAAMSSTPPRRPPASSTAPTAASTPASSVPAPVRADQPSARNGPPLASTYDPSRVIPAANGKLRQYRRPHDDVVIELRHPCTRCGQDHFNFEHTHLVPAVRVMEVDDDDYPEVNSPAEGASF